MQDSVLSQALTCRKLSFHISIVEYNFWMKKDATHDFWIGALLWMLTRRHISPKCLEIPGGLLSFASPTNFPVAYCLLMSIGWWTLWRNFDSFLELLHSLVRNHQKGEMVREIIITMSPSCPKEMIVTLLYLKECQYSISQWKRRKGGI